MENTLQATLYAKLFSLGSSHSLEEQNKAVLRSERGRTSEISISLEGNKEKKNKSEQSFWNGFMSCIKLMNWHRPSLAVSVAAGKKSFYIQRFTPANHPRHLDCLNPMWNISHGYVEQLHLAPQVSLLSSYLTHFRDFLPVFINWHWYIWQIVVSDSHQHACNIGSVMLKQRTMCSSTGVKKKMPNIRSVGYRKQFFCSN